MASRAWLVLLVVAPGCGRDALSGFHGPPVESREKPALVTLPGCGAVVDSLRAAAIAEMNARLDEQMARVLANVQVGCQCPTCNGGGGTPTTGSVPPPAVPTTVDSASDSSNGLESASSYSTTNNQVAGVDEADFIKNDGGYIYLASAGAFQIIDAWPPAQRTESPG